MLARDIDAYPISDDKPGLRLKTEKCCREKISFLLMLGCEWGIRGMVTMLIGEKA